MKQERRDAKEYRAFISNLMEARGKPITPSALDEAEERFLRNARASRTVRLPKDLPAKTVSRITDPFWQVLMNRDLGYSILPFVAYLAITKGSITEARHHFRVNRFTFWEWLNAARSSSPHARRSRGRRLSGHRLPG